MPPKKPIVRVAVPTPPRMIAPLVGLLIDPCLARHDVLHGLRDIGLGQIVNPSVAEQRDNVSLDSSHIGEDRRRLLRASSLAQNETLFEVGEIASTEFLDSDRLAIERAVLGWFSASSDLPQQGLGLAPSGLRCPNTMQTDRVTTRASGLPILNNVAPLARREDAEPESG